MTLRPNMPFRITFALVCATLVAACDVADSELPASSSATATLRLDMSSMVTVSRACRSILSEVRLSIGGKFVESAEIDEGGMVGFDSVRVPIGAVTMGASVLSNEGVEVSEATRVFLIEGDGFIASLNPDPVAALLEVCLSDSEQRIVIKNRGVRDMVWEVLPQGDLSCYSDSPACLSLIEPSGTTSPGDSAVVDFRVNTISPRSFDLLVWTKEGTLGITIDPALSKHHFLTFLGQ